MKQIQFWSMLNNNYFVTLRKKEVLGNIGEGLIFKHNKFKFSRVTGMELSRIKCTHRRNVDTKMFILRFKQ